MAHLPHNGSKRVVALRRRLKAEREKLAALRAIGEARQIENGDWLMFKGEIPMRMSSEEESNTLWAQKEDCQTIIASILSKLRALGMT